MWLTYLWENCPHLWQKQMPRSSLDGAFQWAACAQVGQEECWRHAHSGAECFPKCFRLRSSAVLSSTPGRKQEMERLGEPQAHCPLTVFPTSGAGVDLLLALLYHAFTQTRGLACHSFQPSSFPRCALVSHAQKLFASHCSVDRTWAISHIPPHMIFLVSSSSSLCLL